MVGQVDVIYGNVCVCVQLYITNPEQRRQAMLQMTTKDF